MNAIGFLDESLVRKSFGHTDTYINGGGIVSDNVAVFGTAWGDEGKARIVHWMSKDYAYTVRYSGGNNCGHTIYHNGKKIVRHLLPSSDFSSSNKAFLGAGMVIHLESLLKEVQETLALSPDVCGRIIVDPDAAIVLQRHIDEDKEKNTHIQSTKMGIGPAYRDVVDRRAIKIGRLIEDRADIIKALNDLGVQFRHMLELKDDFDKSKLLFEGNQSILLDYNFAAYPYCTSGGTGLNGIVNSGFASYLPKKIYGIEKCYSTKSGAGPFPTEQKTEWANELRVRMDERGNTTGRDRRIGFLDLVSTRYAICKSGINTLILTKLDAFDGQKSVQVAHAYDRPLVSGSSLFDAKPSYTDLPGWKDSRDINQIKPFISYIEGYTKTKVEYVSRGVNPEDIIKL